MSENDTNDVEGHTMINVAKDAPGGRRQLSAEDVASRKQFQATEDDVEGHSITGALGDKQLGGAVVARAVSRSTMRATDDDDDVQGHVSKM